MGIRGIDRRRARRDERGVVLIMSVAGVVLALIAAALAVDVGRQALDKREDQSIADMAALDAVRDLSAVQAAALASALRNGFDASAPGNSLVAVRGSVDATNTFTPDPAGTAVEVTVGSALDYVFAPGAKNLKARAVAKLNPKEAGFTLGSNLAAVNASEAPFLNAIFGDMLGGSANVLGWQGLASSTLTVEALRQELLDMGIAAGTLDEMLDAEVTLAQVATATAAALTQQGDSNASLFFGPFGIIAQSNVTSTFKLGNLITVEQGSGASALAAAINAFQLFTGSVSLANGTNLADVDLNLGIPGVTTTNIKLKVIEGQKIVIGPVGVTDSTAQIELEVTPKLNLGINLPPLLGATVKGDLPLTFTTAGATGTLTNITCPSLPATPGSITVAADVRPFSAAATASLRVDASLLFIPLISVNIPTTGAYPQLDPMSQNLTFSYPAEFSPTGSTPPVFNRQAGSVPVGLQGLTTFSASNPTVTVGSLPLGLPIGTVVDTALAALGPVMAQIDAQIVAPLLKGLGVTVGATDVTALKAPFEKSCAEKQYPVLVN